MLSRSWKNCNKKCDTAKQSVNQKYMSHNGNTVHATRPMVNNRSAKNRMWGGVAKGNICRNHFSRILRTVLRQESQTRRTRAQSQNEPARFNRSLFIGSERVQCSGNAARCTQCTHCAAARQLRSLAMCTTMNKIAVYVLFLSHDACRVPCYSGR